VDTNKAVQALALDIVARIASGMGRPFDKYVRVFALPVSTVLSDQKAPARAAALQTLTAMATACEGLDGMLPDLSKALESPNPMQRATLLGWIADWFKANEPSAHLDLKPWASLIVSFLDDRSADVRKGAQAVLPFVIAGAGYDFVMKQTDSLKPASKKSAVPLVQAAHAAAPTRPAAAKGPTKAAASAQPPTEAEPSTAHTIKATIPALVAAPAPRKKLPIGVIPRSSDPRPETPDEGAVPRVAKPAANGVRKPTVTASARPTPPVTPTVAAGWPLLTANTEPKRLRLAKDALRWVNEAGTTRKDLADVLLHQMEPHATKELVALLFSHDHNAVNDHVAGLTMMADFYSNADSDDTRAICVANADLPLKYFSIKAHEPQSNVVSKCLDVLDSVLALLRGMDYQLSEPEAMCFIPTLVYKVSILLSRDATLLTHSAQLGDAREPVRVRVQATIQTLPNVFPYNRVFHLLLDYGLKSKVAKTRQGSLDELAGLLKRWGMSVCEPSKAMPVVASMISDKDPQVRKSVLNTLRCVVCRS
jgi:cytoskeleton-associated protein 5